MKKYKFYSRKKCGVIYVSADTILEARNKARMQYADATFECILLTHAVLNNE